MAYAVIVNGRTDSDYCFEGESTVFPQAFLNRMQEQLGEEYPAFLQSMERPRAVALQRNPVKGMHLDLPFGLQPVPWEPQGFYYDAQARPGLHPYHEAGVYYMQEASAMSAVSLLDPLPGERICDLCAAPGGKSTQIAGRMLGQGFLLCNEINPKRAKILSRNIERMGIGNAVVTNEHPQRLAEKFYEYFDRVLIDAPCSGEGMFRKEEAAVTDWSMETVLMCAKRQHEILCSGAQMVRPGGRLVYSTCTFATEENERSIEMFLQTHPDFSLEEANAPWFTPAGVGMFRLWPHHVLGEGHFVAVLKKEGNSSPAESIKKTEQLPKELQNFIKELNIALPVGKLLQFGQTIYLLPHEMQDINGIKVVRPGLELGEMKKGRFEPAHALAIWLSTAEKIQNFSAESQEIKDYLHGDVVPSSVKGWCLVTVDNCTLGWGKGDGKVLKNHYPKGLRR